MVPLTPTPLGGKSRYAEASASLAAQFNEFLNVYVNNRAYVPESFSVHIDALSEGIQLLQVLRELAKRKKDGLSNRDRQEAAELEKKVSGQVQSLLTMSSQAIKFLLEDD